MIGLGVAPAPSGETAIRLGAPASSVSAFWMVACQLTGDADVTLASGSIRLLMERLAMQGAYPDVDQDLLS